MRTTVPPAFKMSFVGPDEPYEIAFQPTDEWDGIIDVLIGGVQMRWHVFAAERKEDGRLVLGGMTAGSHTLWNDEFWFELRLEDTLPVIRYWGDKVIWREDWAVSHSGG